MINCEPSTGWNYLVGPLTVGPSVRRLDGGRERVASRNLPSCGEPSVSISVRWAATTTGRLDGLDRHFVPVGSFQFRLGNINTPSDSLVRQKGRHDGRVFVWKISFVPPWRCFYLGLISGIPFSITFVSYTLGACSVFLNEANEGTSEPTLSHVRLTGGTNSGSWLDDCRTKQWPRASGSSVCCADNVPHLPVAEYKKRSGQVRREGSRVSGTLSLCRVRVCWQDCVPLSLTHTHIKGGCVGVSKGTICAFRKQRAFSEGEGGGLLVE